MGVPEVSDYVLSTSFSKFSVPSKDEGFDEIRFEWSKGPKCEEYLNGWVLDKKQTTRMEDLKPSTWFHVEHAKFLKELKEWQTKGTAHKAAKAKKEADKITRGKGGKQAAEGSGEERK